MRLLITGGTGFFGRAFAKHALEWGYTVCIYSRNEYNQFLMRQEFGDDPRLRWFIGDVRDRDRLRRAMQGVDVVVSAAALKRIEIGHYAPDEMVKTNVLGSLNVVEASAESGVSKVVALSTDKAWQGRSPYGQSKAIAESLFLSANNIYGEHGPKYSVVRYGNIWRSTGSIVPYWESLIAKGETTVPVTDPECTRFFMRASEAVDLVSDTIITMNGGELVIPETLPAYRIGDLAEAMGVSMNIIGLPKFEKLHEGMRDGLTSDKVRRMSVEELREALKNV